MNTPAMPELQDFLAAWQEDANKIKPLFTTIYETLAHTEGVSLEYKGRPGVSHSLRAKHKAQSGRSLFVLVDVIDDAPSARWLSVCFYADLVDDPEGRGDIVPAGLMGEDACCFDVDGPDARGAAYIMDRIKEAAGRASGS